MTLAQVRKAVTAALGIALTWALAALPDGRITTTEWLALVAGVLGAFGVYAVPNAGGGKTTTTRKAAP